MFSIRNRLIKNFQVHLDHFVRMSEKLDVVIFGASGYTGKCCVFEAVSVLEHFKWGIAGRNREKLVRVLKETGEKTKKDLSKIPIIIADIENEKSLREMCSKAKVIVSCCGPYRFMGEAVVRACIEAGAHQIDVSGETQFIELMQLQYNELAKEKGVYVISACGFDSIPLEMGMVFLEKNFDGTLNSVEAYLKIHYPVGTWTSAYVHYGTWESFLYFIAHRDEIRDIRKRLFTDELPEFKPKLERKLFHISDVVSDYCLPFPGSDKQIVERSQRFFYKTEKKRPVQIETYITTGYFIVVLFGWLLYNLVAFIATFSPIRNMLLKYPRFFTFGFISHEGPTEKKRKLDRFSLTLKGVGWPKTEALVEPTDQFTELPKKTVVAKIHGTDPYGVTAVAALLSATRILKEGDKMPGSGGVLPPAAAFAKTSMITELEKYDHGLKFEIVPNK